MSVETSAQKRARLWALAAFLVAGLPPQPRPKKCDERMDDQSLMDGTLAPCSGCGRRLTLDDIGNGWPICLGKKEKEKENV